MFHLLSNSRHGAPVTGIDETLGAIELQLRDDGVRARTLGRTPWPSRVPSPVR